MSLRDIFGREREDGVESDSDIGPSLGERLYDRAEYVAGLYKGERMGQIGIVLLLAFVLVALLAPVLAPYAPETRHETADGQLIRLEGPSDAHLLGTNHQGQDVLSQLLYGTRVSVLVGLLAAVIAVFIGTNVGLLTAYYGGLIDDFFMRLVDIAYGLPFLPFVIVLVFIFGAEIWNIILVISALLWRDSARVVRSEVLTQKERPYVESAKAIGASDFRIIYRHILPNVLPLAFLYMAFAVAYAVIYEASIAFLGYGDPELYSWGRMLFQAYSFGAIRFAWWWVIPPGVALMFLVSSVFFLGRTLEKFTNPELRH